MSDDFEHDFIQNNIPEIEIVPLSKSFPTLTKADEFATKSKQISDDQFSAMTNDIIEPAYDPDTLIELYTYNTRLHRLLNIISRNNAGLGYVISSKKTNKELEKLSEKGKINLESEKEIIEEEIDKVKEFFENCNDELPFPTLFNMFELDRQITGNGFLEFTRTADGELSKIYHVPSNTIRIRKKDKGFVQSINGKKTYFKKFGDLDRYDLQTGINLDKDNDNTTNSVEKENITAFGVTEEDKEIPVERLASEILHHRIYSPEHYHYGVPNWVTTFSAILGNRHSSIRNLAFFKNDALPRAIISILGGKLAEGAKKELEEFMTAYSKNPDKAHRTLILQLAKTYGGSDKPEIKIDKLTVGEGEDQTHGNYRHDNDEEIRESLGYAKVFLGTADDVNRATALVTRQVTNQQEIEPAQAELEFFINKKIIEQNLKCTKVKFTLNNPRVNDDLDDSMVAKNISDVGAMSMNEIRRKINLDEYPAEYKWADLPLVLVLKGMGDKELSSADALFENAKTDIKDKITTQDKINNELGIK